MKSLVIVYIFVDRYWINDNVGFMTDMMFEWYKYNEIECFG